MKLLEVVKGAQTSPEVIAACMQLGKKIKKMPVLAGNCFGFIGNRMLEYYGREAFFLLEEGATPLQVCALYNLKPLYHHLTLALPHNNNICCTLVIASTEIVSQ